MAGWHRRLQTLIRHVESSVGFSPSALFETSSSSGRLLFFSSHFHSDAAYSQKIWAPPSSRPFYCYLQQLGISSSSKLLADEATPVSSPLMPMLPSGGEKSETQKAVTKPAKVQAVLKGIKQSPKKVNLVAELVRGMRVEDALLQLQVTIKRASQTVYQVIHSARANATHNHGLDADRLLVAEAFVGKGFFQKRISYHAKGKCGVKVRPECRLTVVVRETTPEEEAEIAKLKVHNFKKLSKRERRLVPHKLIETTPIWNRKAKSNRGTSNATSV